MPPISRSEAKCSNYCTCKKWSTFISLHGASEILAASLTPVQTLSKHNRSSEDNVRFSSILPLLCPSSWHSELGTNKNSTFTVVFEVCSALLEVLRENMGYARATAHAEASTSRRSQTIWKERASAIANSCVELYAQSTWPIHKNWTTFTTDLRSGWPAEDFENQIDRIGTISELNAINYQSLNIGHIGVWQHGTYFIGSSGLQSGKQDWSTDNIQKHCFLSLRKESRL